MTVTFRRYIGVEIPLSIVPAGSDDGETFGQRLYLLAEGAFRFRIKGEREVGGDPLTAGNFGTILAVCADFVPMIDSHEVANASRIDADGLSWMFVARRSYAEEVTKLVWDSARSIASAMPSRSNLTPPALEEVVELVEATLFPNIETCRRSDERKRELMEVFDAMRSTLRELNGWDPDL